MSATTKIIIGALVTTVLAWFLYGPMGLGARCAVPAVAAITPSPVDVAPAPVATPAAVASCQSNVDAVVKGKTINFANAAASLSPDSIALIDALAASLKDCAGTVVEIAGHTDARGNDAANQALSERRAQTVEAALAARGVAAASMIAKGYGETRPVEIATTAAADAKNRRIEFTISSAITATPAAQ